MYNATRDYRAAILVNGQPVTEVVHQGATFIEGRSGTVYSLLFHNCTNRKAKVVPSVDGLCVIDGQPASIESPGFVVDPHGHVVIPGWKVDGWKAAKFQFAPQGSKSDQDKTYVEAIGADEVNQGTIGFMVFRSRYEGYHIPKYQKGHHHSVLRGNYPRASLQEFYNGLADTFTAKPVDNNGTFMKSTATIVMGAQASSHSGETTMDWFEPKGGEAPLGTKFGDATDFETHKVEFEAADPHNPDAVFVFYYDTIRGLKRRGVPTEAFTKSYQSNRKQPNPFPGSPEIVNNGCPIPKGWRG